MAVEAVSGNRGEAVAPAKEVSAKEAVAVSKNASFREESNFLDDLKESERKALAELRDKVEAAIVEGKLFDDGKPEVKEKEDAKKKAEKAPEEKKEEEEVKNEPEAEEKEEEEGGKKEAEAEGKQEEEESKEEAEKEAEEEEGKKEEAEKKEAGEGEKVAAAAAEEEKPAAAVVVDKDIALWGVPLLPSKGDEATDVVLLKFLRARDFRVRDAHAMLLRCAAWRAEFGADAVLDEDLGFKDLEGVVAYMHGWDRDGHPVCYNAYGVFKDRGMYERVFGDGDRLARFLRWRVQVMERGVRALSLRPGGVNAIIQVTDLKDMPKRELRAASNQILSLFQDNYPEMVARKVFINVPWYFSVLFSMISPFLTERTKSKFVIAREGNVAETLYKFIRPELVPVQYGGLSRAGDLENGPPKPASEFTIKGGEKVFLEIDGIEAGATITWDLVVGGWDLEYGAEYVPAAEESYTLCVEKTRMVLATAEEPVHNAFTAREAGKMVLSIDNSGSRKRKVAAYRYFVRKPSA